MPITEELNNVRKLESVGFSHEQAETLSDVIEKAQGSGQESLKEFIHNENKTLRNEFDTKINELRNELGNEIKGFRNELGNEIKDIRNELGNEIKGFRNELGNEIKDIRNELGNEIKGFRNELKLLITEKNNELNDKIGGLEVRMVTSQKDMLIKIFGIIVGTVGIAVTILKLFP